MVRDLEDKTLNLESKLQEAKEQLHLTIEYPDLNGPVNKDLVGESWIIEMSHVSCTGSVRYCLISKCTSGKSSSCYIIVFQKESY